MGLKASTSQETATADEAWARLHRGHLAARRSLAGELLSKHGLSVNDYEALLLLSRAEGGCMRRVDLAERLQLTPSGVTRRLDGLERQGLVQKSSCSTDGRVSYAGLTKAGRRKLEQATACKANGVRSLFEQRFSPEELQTLADLLGRLPGCSSDRAGAA